MLYSIFCTSSQCIYIYISIREFTYFPYFFFALFHSLHVCYFMVKISAVMLLLFLNFYFPKYVFMGVYFFISFFLVRFQRKVCAIFFLFFFSVDGSEFAGFWLSFRYVDYHMEFFLFFSFFNYSVVQILVMKFTLLKAFAYVFPFFPILFFIAHNIPFHFEVHR